MLKNKKEVLDHGFVRLIDSMGDDLSIVRSARVSYDAAWRSGEDKGSDKRLLKYLWDHNHTTPFEAVTLTFEVYAPIFVIREWHRHRTWSYNELSARYRELPCKYYIPSPNIIGTQSKDNKQGRDVTDSSLIDKRSKELEIYDKSCSDAFKVYKKLLNEGWPKELARNVLPVTTYTHMFCTVNLLNLFKFIRLRSDDSAQYEIRKYSDAMLDLVEDVVPESVKCFKNRGY